MTRDESAAGGAGQVTSGQEPAGKGVPFDTSRAHMARVYDFWLGGKGNFAADRVVAEPVAAAYADVLVAGPGAAGVPGPGGALPSRGGRHPPVPGHRDRAAVGEQHPPGPPRPQRRSRGWCTWATTVANRVVHTVQNWSGYVHRTREQGRVPGQASRAAGPGSTRKVTAGHGWNDRRRLWRASLEGEMTNEETR